MTLPQGGSVSVVGGTGGLTANAGSIFGLGSRYTVAADDCRRRARALRSLLDQPLGLLTLAFAGAPPAGLPPQAAGSQIEASALVLEVLAVALDDIGTKLIGTALDYGELERHVFGSGLGGLLDDVAGLTRTVAGDSAVFWAMLAGTHDVSRSMQNVFTSDPGQFDPVVRGLAPGVSAFDLLADDGRGVVRAPGVDGYGTAGVPPRSLTDLLGDLAQRDEDGRSGEIDVRILTMRDGGRKAIVDVTGTKSWSPLPTHDVTSLSTNARAVVGLPTAYEQGVLAAMRRAGVRPDDDVLMVGHSEGGMVVANAARDAVRNREFTVTHVVTVGAPIGRSVGRMPDGTSVLALENRADVVPHLDGHANPDRRNVTTVTGRAGDGTVSGDHDIAESYEPIAREAESSRSRSIRDFLTGVDGYFRGESVVTHTYQIERV